MAQKGSSHRMPGGKTMTREEMLAVFGRGKSSAPSQPKAVSKKPIASNGATGNGDMMGNGPMMAQINKTAKMMGMTPEECLDHCKKFAVNMKGDMPMDVKIMKATAMMKNFGKPPGRGK